MVSKMRVFIAGASGVIGQKIIPLLVRDKHEVQGMTRSESKAGIIKSLGASSVVCDVYDLIKLRKILLNFNPKVIISQLTDLPDDPSLLPENGPLNSRMRREGVSNLLKAAAGLNARFICQSVAWKIPGPGGEAVNYMENLVLKSAGIVVRYGQFYGPSTYHETEKPDEPRIDINEAARLTLEALTVPSGIYVADDSGKSLQPVADTTRQSGSPAG
jgi:nucleoside-diphosphate-sugar epimerase